MNELHLILILIIIAYLMYLNSLNKSYEHMTNLSEQIDKSVNAYINKIHHYDVCQIQQPQLGKNRPYVNWQKIHDYGDLPY